MLITLGNTFKRALDKKNPRKLPQEVLHRERRLAESLLRKKPGILLFVVTGLQKKGSGNGSKARLRLLQLEKALSRRLVTNSHAAFFPTS
jgi:hypothetical protein